MNQRDDTSDDSTSPATEEPVASTETAPTIESGQTSTSSKATIVFTVLFWAGVATAIALANDSSRTWLTQNREWFVPLALVLLAVLVVALLAGWVRTKSSTLRASVYLLVVLPLVGVGAAALVMLPPTAQMVALRSVALAVLVFTPALMWWLFIATQRASLLNEFIVNLERLGLLDVLPEQVESSAARETRISSYLQKFEGTYGGLPDTIRRDVVNCTFRSYSSEEARDRTSLTVHAVPVTLALVTMLVGWILVLPPVDSFPDDQAEPRWLLALSPNATPVTFAFLGAYFFSLQMLFRRYVRGDLRGSAYVATVLRVVLATVGIWVLEGIGEQAGYDGQTQLMVLAFIVGVFPVVVWQVISGIGSKLFDFVLPSLSSRQPLNHLNGLTVWHEARLEEEDVENVQNMATADIVDLLVNTRIPVTRLIDWIDQAILLTQLGPEIDRSDNGPSRRHQLGQHGIRSASAFLMATSQPAQLPQLDEVLAAPDSGATARLLAALQTNDNLAPVLRWHGIAR